MLSDEEITSKAKKFALLNAADHSGIANPNAVVGRLLSENAELRKDASKVKSIVAGVVASINGMNLQQQKRLLDEEFPGELESSVTRKREQSRAEASKRPQLPDLPDASPGNVVTRFPPEPNGFMHIGHAKAAILGLEYARKYEGKFIVRFDDTNPAAEKLEYYGAFLEAFEWLQIKPDLVRNASDDMEKFYQIAQSMIDKFAAYVCSCSQEKMRDLRAAGFPCEHRSQSRAANTARWNEMLSGKVEAKNSVLRFVGNMQSLNTTMRDPVLFRIVDHPHPLKGNEFRVYPTYDFDGPLEDSLDGVTHAMRSKEYELRDELYYAILDSVEFRKPRIIEFSRLALKNTTVSKRSLRKLIEEGKVEGWDDPRLPTIAGLRRRGIQPETIREFVLQMGISKVESLPTWDLLESINRKVLDPRSKRYFFVGHPYELEIEGHPTLKVVLKYHPDSDFGERAIETQGKFLISASDGCELKPGDKFRLMETYNCELLSVDDRKLKAVKTSDNIEEKIPKIQWVTPEDSVPFTVTKTAPLLIEEEYNPNSLEKVEGRIEKSASALKVGEMFQLVRLGFCRLDSSGAAILAHK